MFDIFETYITSKADFTRDELKLMRSLAITKKIRRRHFLLQEGEVSRYKIFVCKGLLKNTCIMPDGTEHIMRFAPEKTWTLDPESYNNQIPSRYNIEALEDSEIIQWSHENFNKLIFAVPALRIFSEKLMIGSLDASQQRILMNISYTSEEKYQAFINSFPDVFRRVPLHMVASYLGVSRETLSRIRHAQMKQ